MRYDSIYFSFTFFLFLTLYYTILRNYKLRSILIFSCLVLIYLSPLAFILCVFSTFFTFKIGNLIQINNLKINNSIIYITGILFLIFNLIIIKHINYFPIFDPKIGLITQFGLSFYTLQNISYLIDIKKNRITNKNFTNIILYNIYFPRFLSGPIQQPKDFFLKFNESISQKFNSGNISAGLNLVLIGTFKKMVLSDRLSPIIENHFSQINENIGLTNLIVSILFTFQLYFDFSGYTDIARGVSKTLGFDLIPNFKLPLRAKSISEFWRKWHISLTNWLTNYIFYPISFKLRKQKKLGTSIAIIVTFLISGLWHGIGTTFIIYASLHALYLILEHYTVSLRDKLKLPKAIGILTTLILVSIAFIFFRSENLYISINIFSSLFDINHFIPENFENQVLSKIALGGDLFNFYNLYITLLLCVVYLFFESTIEKITHTENINILFYFIILLLILAFGTFGNNIAFIYNQF